MAKKLITIMTPCYNEETQCAGDPSAGEMAAASLPEYDLSISLPITPPSTAPLQSCAKWLRKIQASKSS